MKPKGNYLYTLPDYDARRDDDFLLVEGRHLSTEEQSIRLLPMNRVTAYFLFLSHTSLGNASNDPADLQKILDKEYTLIGMDHDGQWWAFMDTRHVYRTISLLWMPLVAQGETESDLCWALTGEHFPLGTEMPIAGFNTSTDLIYLTDGD